MVQGTTVAGSVASYAAASCDGSIRLRASSRADDKKRAPLV
jgi:hypothetical protein